MRTAARRIGALGLATLAAGAGVWTYSALQREPLPEIGGYVLAEPRALPGVTLVDEQAAVFTPRDFAGHWSLLYFGYTYCPDVCPLTLNALSNVKRQLETEPGGKSIAYYFVSVDPQRDTPQRLREYVAYFDPEFRGLTGTPDALTELATAAASLFVVPDDRSGDHYLVTHSSNVVVLNPSGAVAAVLTPPHDPSQVVADVIKVRAHHEIARGR